MITARILRDVSIHCNLAPFPCVIAGGAPRDIDHGLIPKDIDIFCSVRNEEDRQRVLEYFTEEMFYNYIDDSEGEEYGENLEGILKVSNLNYGIEQPVQIIFLDATALREAPGDTFLKKVFNKFDLSICQIGLVYDHHSMKTKIYKSGVYKSDKDSKRFMNTDENFRRTLTPEQKTKIKDRADAIARKLEYRANCHWNGDDSIFRVDYRPRVEPVAAPQPFTIREEDVLLYQNFANQAMTMTQPRTTIPGWVGRTMPQTFTWNNLPEGGV